MAILAFLDTGIDGTSKLVIADDALNGKQYEVGSIVRKALEFLVAQQKEDGSFAREGHFLYVDALATRALCEAFSALQDPKLGAKAQVGLNFLQAAQRRSPDAKGAWGWRYVSRTEVGEDAAATAGNPYDSDTSVTGWCIGALRAGQIVGLEVDPASIAGGDAFVRHVAEMVGGQPTGLVGYLDSKGAASPSAGAHAQFRYHPAAMSAVGIFVRRAAGAPARDPFFVAAADKLLRDMPMVSDDRLSVDYYYWHHGTLATSFLGGPDAPKRNRTYWFPWKKVTTDALITLQDRAEGRCTHGGWLTLDRWSNDHGGPVLATALNVLTLQLCE